MKVCAGAALGRGESLIVSDGGGSSSVIVPVPLASAIVALSGVERSTRERLVGLVEGVLDRGDAAPAWSSGRAGRPACRSSRCSRRARSPSRRRSRSRRGPAGRWAPRA